MPAVTLAPARAESSSAVASPARARARAEALLRGGRRMERRRRAQRRARAAGHLPPSLPPAPFPLPFGGRSLPSPFTLTMPVNGNPMRLSYVVRRSPLRGSRCHCWAAYSEETMDLLHQWQREAPLAQRLTNGAPEGSARALLLVPRLPVLALTLDAAIPWALACSASQAARRGEAGDA